jgi:protein-disulfide isomerase
MEPETPRGDQMTGSPLEPAASVEPAASARETGSADHSNPPWSASDPTPDAPVELEPVPVPAIHTGAPNGSSSPLRILGYLLAAIAGVVLTLAVLVGSGSVAVGTPDPTATSSPPPTFAMDGSTMGLGSSPVTIEVWADYQCPYCGLMAHGVEPSLTREYAATGEARVDFRDFAFLGQESVDAAVAAQCAGREGLFWRYHDLLFASQSGENQGAFVRDRLIALAKFAGTGDVEAFTACLDDPSVAQAVTTETEEGRGYGVDSTPTLRITGPGPTQFLTGVSDLATIAAAVEKASTPEPSPSPGAGPSSSPGPGAPGASASPTPAP